MRTIPTSLVSTLVLAGLPAFAMQSAPVAKKTAPKAVATDSAPAPVVAAPADHADALPREDVPRRLTVRLAEGVTFTVDEADRYVIEDDRALGRRILLDDLGLRFVHELPSVPPADLERARAVGLDGWWSVEVEPGVDASTVAAALAGLGDAVRVAQVDGLGGIAGEDVPNDAAFGFQWGMHNTGQMVQGSPGLVGADVRALGAWAITNGDPDLVVGVLDSGVNQHVELTARVLPGWNVPDLNTQTGDVCSHGTRVGGVLAARGDNGLGVAGAAWNVRLLPVVVVDPCGGPESWVADGIVWAVDNGADVLNMSLQYYAGTDYLHAAVQYAAAADVPMISATGNNADPQIAWPARFPEVIAVAGTDNRDRKYAQGNFGPNVDLAGPAVNVYSTSGLSSYGYVSGTSFAVPHVAGTVALLRSIDPDLDSESIRTILVDTARDVLVEGWDEQTGAGVVDMQAALEVLVPPTPDADLNGNGIVDGGDILILLAFWGECDGCPADLTRDGVVDGRDVTVLLSLWG